MNEIKKILSYLNKKDIITISILTLVSSILSVIIPYIIGITINNIGKDIKVLLIILVTFFIINYIISLITNNVIIKTCENTIYDIRKNIIEKLEQLPLSFFDKIDKGNIMSTVSNDLDKISDSLSEVIITTISGIITFIGSIVIMFYMNIMLSIIIILTVPLFFIIVSKMSNKMNEYFIKTENLLASLTSKTEETVSSLKTIKNINEQKYFINEFDKVNKEYKKISLKANIYSYIIIPINIIINNLSNILIIGIGSILVVKNKLTIGEIIAFLSYASMFRNPINDLASITSTISEAIAASKRIFNIIEEKTDMIPNKKPNIKGNIKFKNLFFKYNEKDILKNINFDIKEKELVALVGETGSGKTTIINLIMKFYKAYKGEILIDNVNINDINDKYLRDNIGIVLQETQIFKDTVLENIKYGKNIEEEKIIEICEQIGLHNFINKLPNKYNTIINPDNLIISEGEKQLIQIARILVLNPKILILDEATSDIDIESEKIVYDAIKKLEKDKTCIVIAHRLSTIKSADKIIVLEKGRIKEIGNHKNLINKKGFYYNIYNKQFK